MSAALFLVEEVPGAGGVVTLDGSEGHHAATVARVRVGEEILLGDGRGTLATATATGLGKGTLTALVQRSTIEPAPQPRLVVVQGIAKGDRGELAVQAMTEVGVDVIIPWAAARSIAKWDSDKPHRRWVETAREAAKQSRRAWLPVVEPAATTAAVTARLRAAATTTAIVLHEEGTVPFSSVELPSGGEIILVVGPEGGIAPAELAAFEAATVARLGSTVLRTSTAGPAALAVLNARLGRW